MFRHRLYKNRPPKKKEKKRKRTNMFQHIKHCNIFMCKWISSGYKKYQKRE